MENLNPAEPAPKKNNTVLIVAIVLVVLLCCCCVGGLGGWWLWENGDSLMNTRILSIKI